MKTIFNMSSRLAMATLLGLALTACVGAGQANAQGKMKKDKSSQGKMSSDTKMMHDDHMTSGGAMDDDDRNTIPMAPEYPMAAPGGVHMYHWTDFTMMHMGSGSAMDKKTDKMMNSRMMVDEDETNVLPMTMHYPNAAPGTLDLYHWSDFTRTHMMSGSAMDTKMDREKTRDEKRMKRDRKMK